MWILVSNVNTVCSIHATMWIHGAHRSSWSLSIIYPVGNITIRGFLANIEKELSLLWRTLFFLYSLQMIAFELRIFPTPNGCRISGPCPPAANKPCRDHDLEASKFRAGKRTLFSWVPEASRFCRGLIKADVDGGGCGYPLNSI